MSSVPQATSDSADELVKAESQITLIWQGRVVRAQKEKFVVSNIETVREVIVHPGAVGVIAVDANGRFGAVKQYRHPVRSYLIEPVAGLMDKLDETYLESAQRELLEEAGLISDTWSHLIDLVVSPGGSSEIIRFFLAEDCQLSPVGRIWSQESEEKDMQFFWLSEQDLLGLIESGKISNSPGIAAWLTAFYVLKGDSRISAEIAWPLYEHLREGGGLSILPLDLPNKDGKL